MRAKRFLCTPAIRLRAKPIDPRKMPFIRLSMHRLIRAKCFGCTAEIHIP